MRSTSRGFLTPFLFHFNSLTGWRFLRLGVEYSLMGRWRQGYDFTCLHQLPFLSAGLLKPLHMHSKSYFPLNFPLLVKRHTWKALQQSLQPGKFCCACSAMLCRFYGQGSLFRCLKFNLCSCCWRHSSMFMISLSAKQGGGFAFCLMSMYEKAVLGSSPVFPALLGPE